MGAKMHLGPVEKYPRIAPALCEPKGLPESARQRGDSCSVTWCKPGMRYQPTEKDFGHQVLRHGKQVLVGYGALWGLGHRHITRPNAHKSLAAP